MHYSNVCLTDDNNHHDVFVRPDYQTVITHYKMHQIHQFVLLFNSVVN